ncbi:uncharacterized protein LOC128224088 [Mya arenaria]|uniref:uncharacterized protein LOC128224088 n=1 Tax=Mya arenaria TaxID=6604 RepID=UPI0022E68C0B|nr:uncharacterized protein LOC128224088 [Mya arenaria]
MAISNADVFDRNLDESTKQTEGSEGAETSSHDEGKNLHVHVMRRIYLDEETRKSLGEIRSLYGYEILLPISRVVGYHEYEARRRLKLNSLPEELRRKLERMAEAEAGVNELMGKLEVLFELFLYVCLILETSTSKQTRRSKEDKCIVHILLLRSGVESNPGPRTWIDYLREWDKPTKDDLMYLSGRIGNGWRHLGARLRLRQAQLDHIEYDHKGMQNQIYHMLLESTKSGLEASLKDILLMLDVASTEFTMTVDWDDITLRFANNGQEQQLMLRDVANPILARMVDVENKIANLQAENRELKTKIATLERVAQKRNAEEGETSTDVKRVKQQ